MNHLLKCLFGTALSILAVSAGYGQNPLDWQIKTSASGNITETNKYGLWCRSENDFLTAERRDWGVNLVWKSANPANVRFERQNGNGEIKAGERVAIFFNGEKGGYLYYKKQDHGINLEFSSTPKYEWEIRNDDNQDGRPIAGGSKVAIYVKWLFIQSSKKISYGVVNGESQLSIWPGVRTVFALPVTAIGNLSTRHGRGKSRN